MNADVSISPLPSALATVTLPAAPLPPAPPRRGKIRAQFDGVAETVVHAPQNHVHLLEPFERLEENAAVAHRQIAALHQRETEITRQIGVLEIGFVERPGRQQHHARIVASEGESRSSVSRNDRKNEASRWT